MINTIMLSAFARVSNIIARLKEERGQDILEYAVLVGAIALVAAAALFVLFDESLWGEFTDRISACLSFDMETCGEG